MTDKNEDESKTFTISLKTVSTTLGGIVAILTGIWALDSHYASAADVQQIQRSIEYQVRAMKVERDEDELLKLDMKKQAQGGKLEPPEEALRQRYARRLEKAQIEEKKIQEETSQQSQSRGLFNR
jgi:hypothetical protein